ncbi:membrane protein FAM174B isoform 1 precursor [Danio rerio]|nr:membrane protein FAM174B isoform 1 precursor [Danio rerio]|eukprot:NP_001076565.1 membrane protein FAM174B isoform 1 precursor [Danio rerio]
MWLYTFAVALIVIAQEINGEPHTRPSSATPLNATLPPQEEGSAQNTTDAAVGSRLSTILRDLPTIKNISIFICVLTTLLITCLVIKICRSARKIRKTRKYDIITTPAERVEMAPLNEENDEEDDSTLFDVKYRCITTTRFMCK